MIIFLIVVIGLIGWSLRLLQRAIASREFSLMLAGALVAISAAGVVVVYALMDGCMGYLTTNGQQALPLELSAESLLQSEPMEVTLHLPQNFITNHLTEHSAL